MDEKITKLDGNVKEQTIAIKKFFGLKPEQSFQDLIIDEEEQKHS